MEVFLLLAILVGAAGAVLYLVGHWLVDKTSERPKPAPIRRSMDKVPVTVVPRQDHEAMLRKARVLLDELVDEWALGIEMRAEAEVWLSDYDASRDTSEQLLKRVYLILLGMEAGHKTVPMLSAERAARISAWLTEYLGKEERE